MKRRVVSVLAAVIGTGVGVVTFATPAYAVPHVVATGVITCNMVTTSTSGGSVTPGLSATGSATHVTVRFTATFKCAPPAPSVTFPGGRTVVAGTLKGVARYNEASASQP
ncbi:MAG: hypothetical protein ACRD6W_10315, partial [Nitrososphaerales archaeon]